MHGMLVMIEEVRIIILMPLWCMNPGIGENEQTSCDRVCGLQHSLVPLSIVDQSFFPRSFLQKAGTTLLPG